MEITSKKLRTEKKQCSMKKQDSNVSHGCEQGKTFRAAADKVQSNFSLKSREDVDESQEECEKDGSPSTEIKNFRNVSEPLPDTDQEPPGWKLMNCSFKERTEGRIVHSRRVCGLCKFQYSRR